MAQHRCVQSFTEPELLRSSDICKWKMRLRGEKASQSLFFCQTLVLCAPSVMKSMVVDKGPVMVYAVQVVAIMVLFINF